MDAEETAADLTGQASIAPTLGQRIRAGRARRGLSQQALAELVGVQRATVSQWETDRERPGRDKAVALAAALSLSLDGLLSGGHRQMQGPGGQVQSQGGQSQGGQSQGAFPQQAEMQGRPTAEEPAPPAAYPPAPSAVARPPQNFALAEVAVPHFRTMPQNVPVLGNASAGNGEQYRFNGSVADYVRRPPGIAGGSQVFAAYVVGESMYPAFRDGQLFFVHPGRRPRIGDDVLVELQPQGHDPGPSFLKRLVRNTPTQVVVEQFNPIREFPFDKTEIRNLFKVLTLDELVGI